MTYQQAPGFRYLAVGLFARRTIDALIAMLDSAKEEHKRIVVESMESLRALEEGGVSVRPLHHYEQFRVVQEAFSPEEREQLLEVLQRIVDASCSESRKWLQEAIRLFYRLEQQALINYERPPQDSIPEGVFRLCRKG